MELPNLGQQCSQINCKQLNFLPLQCKCNKQFCSEHFNVHVTQCESFINLQAEPQKFTNTYKCANEGCIETSLIPIIGPKCHQNFCIKHRHLSECFEKDEKTRAEEKEKIAAPVRKFNEAKLKVDKQIEQNLLEAKKRGKRNDMANKVQLMKLKNKAKGLKTIPTSDRVYFNVIHPENSEGHPVFVSKYWSVGRSIDAIADECKLKNDNNKNVCKKLRLFKKDSKESVSINLSINVQNLIDGGIVVDGENLIMDYVDDDCKVLVTCD